jgi:hypothetical protein
VIVNTTRKHPRTIAEAWQRPPAPATTFTGPYTRPPRRPGRVLLGLALIAAGLAAIFYR